MKDKEFNLIDEKWIRVMAPDGSVHELSLAEVLINAHKYKRLAGEMEAQNIALLRLLISVVHSVFTRVGLDGNDDPVQDEDNALGRWRELFQGGRLPEKPIQDYLARYYDRFWLFHPEQPFYQSSGACNGTENTAAKLNGEVSESNNKARLFSSLGGSGKIGMKYAESARWLLFLNGFDDCAAKQRDKSNGSRSMSIAWLGKLGLITAVGGNLFETILLNMPMVVNGEELWPEDDLPVWEDPHPSEEERRTIEMPQDLAGLMTLQSRRLLLVRKEDLITGYKVMGGDAFSEQNALNEPMTLWRFMEDKKTNLSYYIPKRPDRSRQIWRDFGAMVNISEKEIRPGVVSWCGYLQKKGVLPRNRMITFQVTCVRYDSSQSSSITDAFSDALSFHADLLLDAGKEWIREINHQLELIEKTALEVGGLAIDLAKACGEDVQRSTADEPKEQFYLAIDIPFRDWLLNLEPGQSSDERLSLVSSWEKQVRSTALKLGRQMVVDKGEVAFVGRNVTENKKTRHYSSPEAYNWYQYHINMIYPYVKEGDETNG